MKKDTLLKILGAVAVAVLLFTGFASAGSGKDKIKPEQRLEPKALLSQLAKGAKGPKPLLLHVGFPVLYGQAHIPGSVFAGPGNGSAGLTKLESALKGVPKDRPVVIYCGCCPWDRCPNVGPAFERTMALGYKDVKVLIIPHNLGEDWADLGYPVTAGD